MLSKSFFGIYGFDFPENFIKEVSIVIESICSKQFTYNLGFVREQDVSKIKKMMVIIEILMIYILFLK